MGIRSSGASLPQIAASLSCGQHALLASEFAPALAITVCCAYVQLRVWTARSYDSGCVPRGPLLRECFSPFLAPTASCASPFASPGLRFHTRPVVLAAWTTHGWSRDLPDVTLANLSLDASSPTPVAPKVLVPVSSLWTSAFPELATGRRLATFRAATSARGRISGLQTFLDVKASSFACHPGRSHRCSSFRRCPCSRLRRRVTISAL